MLATSGASLLRCIRWSEIGGRSKESIVLCGAKMHRPEKVSEQQWSLEPVQEGGTSRLSFSLNNILCCLLLPWSRWSFFFFAILTTMSFGETGSLSLECQSYVYNTLLLFTVINCIGCTSLWGAMDYIYIRHLKVIKLFREGWVMMLVKMMIKFVSAFVTYPTYWAQEQSCAWPVV